MSEIPTGPDAFVHGDDDAAADTEAAGAEAAEHGGDDTATPGFEEPVPPDGT